MTQELDLPKLSADIDKALSLPSGPEKEKLSNEVLQTLSSLISAMSKIAEKIGTPVDSTSHKVGTRSAGRSKVN
jgi:hypothetical protein